MSKSSRNRKLMAALSPVFNGISRLMYALLRGKLQTAGGEADIFAWAPLEALEKRTLLSGGGLLQPFELPNGANSDTVYDSAGNLHVAFKDQSSTTLKYTMRSPGGAWSPIVTVDATTGAGGTVSIAMNTNGYPAIAYYESTADDLKYATYDGTAWSWQTVDSTGDVGKGASLAFNTNGVAFIAYTDNTNLDMKVARWLTDHWSITAIDSTGDVGKEPSLAVNPVSLRYAVVYRDQTNNKLKYYEDTGSTPITAIVDTGTAGQNVFSDTALVFDSAGTPSTAFYRSDTQTVYYAKKSGASFTRTTLESSIITAPDTDMAINASGAIEVAYYVDKTPPTSDEAHVERWDGSTWRMEKMLIGGGLNLSFAENPNGDFTIVAKRDGQSDSWVSDWNRDRWVGVYEYLYNNIEYSISRGAMKGAQATLDTRSGNDWDQASLLISELAKVGVAASYVSGTISAPSSDVAKWVGAADATAADAALDSLKTNSESDYAVLSGDGLTFTSIPHAWVQATTYIPTGTSTKTLDTSWKPKDLSTGITAPLNYVPLSIYDNGDLALLRPATAPQESGYEAGKAVDGDPATLWWTTQQSSPTLEVDLGAPFNINRVRITWGAQFASAFLVETSNDDSTWTTLVNASARTGGTDDFANLAATSGSLARYLRVKSTTQGQSSVPGFSIADLRVFGYDDLGRGHTASASSADASYPVGNLSDGNTTTEWRSTAGGTQWAQIDLGSIVDISGVHLKWGTGYASAYDVKVSDNGSTWKTVSHHQGGGLGIGTVDDISGLATRGRYVQIYMTTLGAGTVYSLFDLEIKSAPKADELPTDIHQAKVRSYLAAGLPGESTAHAPLDGPIVDHQFTNSTTTPGFTIVGSPTVSATIPTNNKQRVNVTLVVSGTTRINYTLNAAEVAGQAISLSYPASGFPELHVDGVAVATSATSVTNGTPATITLTVYSGDGNATAEKTYTYTRTVGQPIGIGLQNEQMSGPMLASLQAKLNTKAAGVYLCNGTTTGDYQDILLGTMAATYMGAVDDAHRLDAESEGLIPVLQYVGTGIVTGDASTIETHWDLPIPYFSPNTGFETTGLQKLMLPSTTGAMSVSARNAALLQLNWQTSSLQNRILSQFINAPSISAWEGIQVANQKGTPLYEIWSAGNPVANPTDPTFYRPFESTTIGYRRSLSLSRVGSLVTAVSSAHGFANGSQVDIRGATQTEYNGTFTITVVDANTFTYTIAGTPASPATGTIVAVPVGTTLNWSSTLDSSYTTAQKDVLKGSVRDGSVIIAPQAAVTLGNWTGAVWTSTNADGTGLYTDSGHFIMAGSDTQTSGSLGVNSPSNAAAVISPVNEWSPNEFSGNIHHSEQDFEFPNVGFPLKFERNYDSLNGDDIGMGGGWSYTYGDKLTVDGSGNVTWHTSEGVNHKFYYDGANYSAIGVFGKLTHSGGTYQYRERNGSTYTFSDTTLRLTGILDANGQGVDITSTSNGPTSVKDHGDSTRAITISYNGNSKISSVADWTGRTWSYTYTQDPSFFAYYLASATFNNDPTLMSVSYGYSSNESRYQLSSIPDTATGGSTIFEYYPNGRAFRITDPEGNQESFSYDLFNHVTRHSDQRGISSSIGFKADGLGLVQTIVNADGTRRDNDWSGTLVTSATDEIGLRETYQYYTGTANVSSHVGKDGVSTSYQYVDNTNSSATGFNFVTQITLPASRVTDYAYDSNGNLTSQTQHNSAESLVTSYTYPGVGNRGLPSSSTEPKGNVGVPDGNYTTDFTYNQAGQVLSATTHPASGNIVRKYTYDSRGSRTGEFVMSGTTKNISSLTRSGSTATATSIAHGYATGDVIEMRGATQPEYNGFFTITVVDANTFTYTVSGSPATPATGTISSEGTVSSMTYTYDLMGQLLTTKSPDPDGTGPLTALTTTNVYKSGNLISVTTPNANTSSFAYDLLGRLRDTVNPDGTRTITRYDAVGNAVETKDALGRSTLVIYDNRNRPIQTIYADDTSEKVRYDAVGRIVASIDELGRTSTVVYDSGSRVASTTDALGQSSSNRYNDVGQLIQSVDWASFTDVSGLADYSYGGNLLPVLATGDFDGNGTADLIRYNSTSGGYAIQFMSGSGVTATYSGTFPDGTTTGWKVIGTGDMDHDDDADILWQNGSDATKHQVWLMNSSGIQSVLNNYYTLPWSGAKLLALKDFDADGDADILWQDSAGNNFTWYLSYMSGSVLSASAGPQMTVSGRTYLGEADVNGDGRADVLLRSTGTNTVFIESVNWAGIIENNAGVLDTNWIIQSTGDIDGNGADDILWHNNSTNENKLWLMRPNKTHLDVMLESDALRTVVGMADFSSDARADLLWSDLAAKTSGFKVISGKNVTVDPLGRVTQVRGSGGFVTSTDYDANSNVTNQTRYDVTGLTSIPADPRSLSSTLKRSVSTQYDVLDRPTTITNPAGKTTSATYDKADRVTSTTDELGRITTLGYDRAGRLTSKTYPDPDGGGPLSSPVENLTLDADGNVIAVSDPLSHVTKSTYDTLNRKTGQFGMSGVVKSVSSITRSGATATVTTSAAHGYNTGDVVEIRGANQKEYNGFFTITVTSTTVFTYTVSGTPASPATGTIVAEKAMASARYVYDQAGNTLGFTDAKNNQTSFAYNSRNRKTTQTQADPDGAGPLTSPVTQYGYDLAGNLTSVTDPLSNVTSYVYDALNRQTQVISPDPDGPGPLTSPVAISTYLFNRITQITDPQGHITSVAYDSAGRKISETAADPDGAGPLLTSTVRYSYDALGNLNTVSDPLGGVTTYAYDTLNRKVGETAPDPDAGGPLAAPLTTYNYDPVGNLTGTIDPTGGIHVSVYDNLNRRIKDYQGPALTISSITRSGTTATVTCTAHGYISGLAVLISGADQPEYNGMFEITVVDANTFTYTVSGSPASPATGTMFADLPMSNASNEYDADGNLTAETDGDFIRNTYVYDALNRKTSMTQPDPDSGGPLTAPVTSYTYDANSNLLTTTDPDSRVSQASYDNLNRQTGSFLLDASANIKTISTITRSGSTATVTTSAAHGYTTGDVVRISGANQPEYNGFFVITVTSSTVFTYAVNGTPATPATAAAGQTLQSLKSLQSSRSTYDAANRLINQYDGQNNRTATSYDNDNRKTGDYVMVGTTKSVTSITRSGSTVTVTATAHGYATGNVVQISGATQPEYNGFFVITNTGANTFTYTINGTPVSPATGTIVAENSVQSTRYTYDAASNLVSVTDGSANVTKFSYDNMDRQIGEFWMNGTVKSISSLTRSGTTATVTSTAHGYTSGDVVEIRGATQAEYNGFFKITVVDANTFTYTVVGTPASPATGTIVAEKTNQNARDEYDANNNNIASTDRNALRRYFVFDKLNRPIEEHWLAAGVAISTITFSSNTATVTTSSAHGYSTNDWVEISGVDQLPYDGLFQITVTSSTTFTYTMASSAGTNGTGTTKLARKSTRKISTGYDAANRITSASDPDSSYTYTYMATGWLGSTDNNGTPNLPRVVLGNSISFGGRRLYLTSTVAGSGDFTNAYSYDGIGRMNSLSQSGTGIAQKRVDIAYNNSGQYSKVTRSSTTGSITEVTHSDYGYDSAKRLTSLVHRKPNNTALVTYSWTYDNQGRVKTFVNPDGTVTYGYDAASQVTSVSGGTLSETYTYDKSGNRTISGYTTGADNRLSSDGTYNYTYDAEGNRTRRTKISDSTFIDYTYDYRNRLTDQTYKTSGGVKTKALHYVYDVNDRRIERQLDATGDGVYESKERYIYDGEDIVLVYNGSNTLINRYLHGSGVDEPLAEESAGSVVKWQLPDEQGSIRDMGDNAGNLVAGSHVIYNSFGVVTSGTPGRYAYTGREWDADAGMYYYRARWYDASIGRFISQDPKGFAAHDSNLYRYVGNNSSNSEDPSGTCNMFGSWDCFKSKISGAFHWIGDRIGDILKGGSEFAKGALHGFFHGTETLVKGLVHGANEVIDTIGDVGDTIINIVKDVPKGLQGVIKGIVDAGGWIAHHSGLGTIGLDLGFVSFSLGYNNGHNTLDFGLFGGAVHFDSYNGHIKTDVGVKLGFGVGGIASISAGFIDSTFTGSVGIGPVTAGLTVGEGNPGYSLTFGKGPLTLAATYKDGDLSEKLNFSPVAINDPGTFNVPLGYTLAVDPHGKLSSSFNIKANARGWVDEHSDLFSKLNKYNDGFKSWMGSLFAPGGAPKGPALSSLINYNVESGHFVPGDMSGVFNTVGKIWNSPNTALGLAIGTAGLLFGGSLPTLGNNAIQFEHNPFSWGGTTLGNVILYGNDFRRGPREDTWFDFGPKPGWGTVGDHERQHTYQGEVLGPLYIPLNLIGMTLGIIQHPTYDLNDLTNGSWNFMEYGPQMNPARPFKNWNPR